MEISCIAIDDEPLALSKLESFIKKVPELKLQKLFESAVEAIGWLKENSCDLIFLDIQMENLTGNQNTIDIITTCVDAGTAARISYDLSLNGYTDWFLPSRDELLKLYDNRAAIGGFSATEYWSSSEATATNAYVVNFSTGANSGIPKTSNKSVRPIRYF